MLGQPDAPFEEGEAPQQSTDLANVETSWEEEVEPSSPTSPEQELVTSPRADIIFNELGQASTSRTLSVYLCLLKALNRLETRTWKKSDRGDSRE